MTVAEKTDTLNHLLRIELSTAEAYEHAWMKAGDDPAVMEIHRLATDHRDSVHLLRQYVLRFGGEPDLSFDACGGWVPLVTDATGLFGASGMCKALREGEENGLQAYEDALRDPNLHPDCRAVVRFTLLPKQRDHIRTLDALMAKGSSAD
jgi:uncharacterized protein (TIGR02284 family)